MSVENTRRLITLLTFLGKKSLFDMRKRAPSKFIYGSAKVAQFSKSTRKIATNNTKKHTTFIVWVGLTWLVI